MELRPATDGAISSKKFDERPKGLRMISLCFHVQSLFWSLKKQIDNVIL